MVKPKGKKKAYTQEELDMHQLQIKTQLAVAKMDELKAKALSALPLRPCDPNSLRLARASLLPSLFSSVFLTATWLIAIS